MALGVYPALLSYPVLLGTSQALTIITTFIIITIIMTVIITRSSIVRLNYLYSLITSAVFLSPPSTRPYEDNKASTSTWNSSIITVILTTATGLISVGQNNAPHPQDCITTDDRLVYIVTFLLLFS